MGRVVVVVGGNRGLGLELVKGFLGSGDEVYVTTRSQSDAQLESLGIAGVIGGIDLEDEGVGDKVVAGLPPGKNPDVLFINAGYFTTETLEELNFKEERKMMEICAFGPLRLTQQIWKAGRLPSGSKVAMITSEGGSIGLRTEAEGGANYGHHMSKAAQNMMGKIMSLDLKPHGVAVVMLHPGFLRTEMTRHYSHLYEEFGAVTPDKAVGPILEAVGRCTLETTGRFVAPMGSEGLGLGVHALPGSYLPPFGELPW